MKQIKIRILSWLLHHANRHTKSDHFYKIKKELLQKYGTFLQYDVQFIHGKKCYTCGGDGIYKGYSEYDGKRFTDHCWNCNATGWYRSPVWNILEKNKFGKYSFHTPWQRSYTKPDIEQPVITGYIEHSYTKHGEFALTALYILFDRKRWWKQWKKDIGWGWRVQAWRPGNWVNNIAYMIKHPDSRPVNNLHQIIQKIMHKFGNTKTQQNFATNEDLPF